MTNIQKLSDLSGMKFNLLTVVRFHSVKRQRRFWLCKCDCGNEALAHTASLKIGNTKSCGCLIPKQGKSCKTHGKTTTRVYRIWRNMHSRCENPKIKSFVDYGQRGITVCQRWFSFENFYEDMGESTSIHHSLDRKDNEKGYSKENCKWATYIEQSNNRRSSVFFEVNGVKYTKTTFAEYLGVSQPLVRRWIQKGKLLEDMEDFVKNRKLKCDGRFRGSVPANKFDRRLLCK